MPTVNRKKSLSQSKQSNLPRKQAIKVFRTEVKAANGGKTRMGRFIKTATNMAASAIPGVGGMVAGALSQITNKPKGEQAQDYVKQLPAFEQATTEAAQNLGASAMNAAANAGADIKPAPVVLMNTPAPIAGATEIPAKEQSLGQVANTQKVMAGGGGSAGNEETDEEPQTRASFAPKSTPEKTGEPAAKNNKNKILYIAVGAVVLLLIIFLIAKAAKK